MTVSADTLIHFETGLLALGDDVLAPATHTRASVEEVGTVVANMAHYGVAPSAGLLEKMQATSPQGLVDAWDRIERILAAATAEDRNIADFVVYQNFPREVLDMSAAGYWLRQVGMYLGLPNALFTEVPEARAPLDERLDLRAVDLAGADADAALMARLRAMPTRWRPVELDAAQALAARMPGPIDAGDFATRVNAVALAVRLYDRAPDTVFTTTSATDVLRFAAGLADGDITLGTPTRFGSFPRRTRRMLVALLEQAVDLEGDFARRPAMWKRLLSRLHPGEFDAPRVSAAYHALYTGLKARFNVRLEALYAARDAAALDLLATEPGVFARQVLRAYSVFGAAAFTRFADVMESVTTDTLLTLERHLDTLESRTHRLVRPRGKWDKAQVIAMPRIAVDPADRDALVARLREVRAARLAAALPEGVALDAQTATVHLPVSGQELAPYGPGTVFPLPAEATFLRTASFWKEASKGNTWFDNGWNFFGPDWTPLGACCWNEPRFDPEHPDLPAVGSAEDADTVPEDVAAVFSGDPTNADDLEGRGAQLIDLYIDRLAAAGVRYAVWSVLCYSHISFREAEDVVATLQWGVDPEAGKLYEPGRAQMSFPISGQGLTRFVAMLDIARREVVALDMGLPARVSSAAENGAALSRLMPAVVDHIAALPRVHDLFAPLAAQGPGATPVRRSDADAPVSGQAWVFEPRNAESAITPLDLEELRRATG